MSRLNELLLDFFTFILHIAVFAMLIAGAGFMVAPLFGVYHTQTEIVQAVFFAIFAITILVFDIKLIAKRRFGSYLVIYCITLTALLMWCLIISAYDMSKVLIVYLALGILLLILKRKLVSDRKRSPNRALQRTRR